MEAVEQRTGVERTTRSTSSAVDGRAEVVQVAADARRIEEQSVAGGRDGAVAERGAEDVHREVEQPARAGRVLLRPEQRHRAVARERLRPGGDDEREEGDAMALRRRAAERRVPERRLAPPSS